MNWSNTRYVLYGKQDLRPEAKSVPALKPDEVLLKIKRVGICGSDIHYFQHGRVGSFIPTRPFVLGHEAAGEIVAVGTDVTELEKGARVAIDPSQPCHICRYCKEGRYNLCTNMKYLGSASTDPPVDGVFCEYLVLPARCCFKLPDALDDATATLLEPLSVAIHAVKRAGIIYGASVLVSGGGTIGQLILAVARVFGAGHLTLSDVDEGRRTFAFEHFADQVLDPLDFSQLERRNAPGGQAYDFIFEASGAEKSLQKALEVAARGATIVQVGTLPSSVSLPANLIMSKELNLLGSFRFANVFQIALDLATAGKVNLHPIITQTLPFSEMVDAMDLAMARGKTLKVQVAL